MRKQSYLHILPGYLNRYLLVALYIGRWATTGSWSYRQSFIPTHAVMMSTNQGPLACTSRAIVLDPQK